MRIIGITGGIGSGKSTVSRILSETGAKIVDADVIAKEVVRKGGKALDELMNFFGNGILNEFGELDRKKLSGIVFNSPEKLEVLNKITHKYVVEKIIENINIERHKNTDTVVIDVPSFF